MIRVSVVFLFVLFAPVAFQELRYSLFSIRQGLFLPGDADFQDSAAIPSEPAAVEPADREFAVVIPKIGANAKVIPSVDWRDSRVYQRALAEGVAHAEGSAFPGDGGNTFLFAHAGGSPLEALRYNAVFYLLDKLSADDRIDVWYRGTLRTYRVTEKRVVQADEISYVENNSRGEQLTLMTCWPAGTTWKRLIVRAEPS